MNSSPLKTPTCTEVYGPRNWWWPSPELSYDGQVLLMKDYKTRSLIGLDLSPQGLQMAINNNNSDKNDQVEEEEIKIEENPVKRFAMATLRYLGVVKPTSEVHRQKEPQARVLFHIDPPLSSLSSSSSSSSSGDQNERKEVEYFRISDETDRIAVITTGHILHVYDGSKIRANDLNALQTPILSGLAMICRAPHPDRDAGAHLFIVPNGTIVGYARGHEITVADVDRGTILRYVDLGKVMNPSIATLSNKKARTSDGKDHVEVIWSFALSWDGKQAICGNEYDSCRVIDVEHDVLLKELKTDLDRVHEWMWTGPISSHSQNSSLSTSCIVGWYDGYGGGSHWFNANTFESISCCDMLGVRLAPYDFFGANIVGGLQFAEMETGERNWIWRNAQSGEEVIKKDGPLWKPFEVPFIHDDTIQYQRVRLAWKRDVAVDEENNHNNKHVLRIVMWNEHGTINVWE
jgi:hypothetical protein